MSQPANHEPSGYHEPPRDGYEQPYPSTPGNGYDDARYRGNNQPPPPQHNSYDPNTGYPIPPGYVPPHRPPVSHEYDPNNFAPPPQQEYRDDGYGPPPPRSEYDGRSYERAPPSDYSMPPAHSGYGNDGRGVQGQALAPWDEEKAEAGYQQQEEEYDRWQRDQQRRQNIPPPPSDSELNSRRGYNDRDRDRYYDDRDRRSYDDRSYYDPRDRRDSDRDRRRRDSRQSATKSRTKDIFGGGEGERGLGAQILGGAVGGLAGHELGGGLIETLGGVVAGAIGAKVLENQHEKRKNRKEEDKRAAAPYKGDMLPRDRSAPQTDRWPRDDRGDFTRSRRKSTGRRASYDSYSSDGSPPPPRRRYD